MSPTMNYDGTIAGSAVYMAPVGAAPMPDVPRRWYERIPGLRRLYAPRAHRVRNFAGWELLGWVAEDGLTVEPPTITVEQFPGHVSHLWKEDDS